MLELVENNWNFFVWPFVHESKFLVEQVNVFHGHYNNSFMKVFVTRLMVRFFFYELPNTNSNHHNDLFYPKLLLTFMVIGSIVS